jgi:hypothetical protein
MLKASRLLVEVDTGCTNVQGACESHCTNEMGLGNSTYATQLTCRCEERVDGDDAGVGQIPSYLERHKWILGGGNVGTDADGGVTKVKYIDRNLLPNSFPVPMVMSPVHVLPKGPPEEPL